MYKNKIFHTNDKIHVCIYIYYNFCKLTAPAHRHLFPSLVPWTSHVQLLPTVLSEIVVLAVIRKIQ